MKHTFSKCLLYSLVSVFLIAGYAMAATEPLEAGGVLFNPPQNWEQTQPHTSMRLFEFKTNLADTEEQAVMAVFYFPGMGGSTESNIERWKNQFTPEPGSAEAHTENIKVNGKDVTLVRLEGTYNGGMGFSGSRPNYAAIAAIIEGQNGPVFFKMTGPKVVIDASQKDFDSLVQTFQLNSGAV